MGGRSRNSRKKYRKTKPQRILIRCGFLVGAGGCREPRRKGTRVAAPSGCIVPWAARASCWPQPQQLLPASAAGSGRRCCTGLFLRRLQRRRRSCSNPPPRVKLKIPDKTKNQRIFYAGLFGGRGWMSRAAHLKKPRRGFFARRTIRRALRVALAAFSAAPWQGFEKAERCPSLASLFPPQAAVGSAVVRIHP